MSFFHQRVSLAPVVGLGVILAVVLFAASRAPAAPSISWTPDNVAEEIAQGQTKTTVVTFTAEEKLSDVSVWITPELRPYVTATPSSFRSIDKGDLVTLTLMFSASTTAPLGTLEGTLHLRKVKREEDDDETGETYAKPLPVTIEVGRVVTGVIPDGSFTIPSNWIGQFHDSVVYLLSPQTLATSNDPGAAHVEPDVYVEVLRNPENLSVSDFALKFADGLFGLFEEQIPTTVSGREAIRFSNVESAIDRAPVIALFVSLPQDSILLVALPVYERDLTPERLSSFDQIVNSLSIE